MQPIIEYKREALNQYQLILDLPAAVKKRFIAARDRFDAFFRGSLRSGSHPFIYLAQFSAYEPDNARLQEALNLVALGMMPFKAHLKNFSALEHREIYIEVAEKAPVNALIENVNKIADGCLQDARFSALPRVTLAKALHQCQFDRCWPFFEKERFLARFIINRMLLLKLEPGSGRWLIERSFLFENLFIRG